MRLYEIANQVREIAERAKVIDRESGEVLAFDPEAIALLDQLEGAFEEKIEKVAAYIKELEAEQEAIKEAVQHQMNAAKLKENEMVRLKEYALACLQAVRVPGERKIKGDLFSIFEREDMKVELIDDKRDEVPENFRRYPEWELNKVEVKRVLKEGEIESVPGTMVIPTSSLVIKKREVKGKK